MDQWNSTSQNEPRNEFCFLIMKTGLAAIYHCKVPTDCTMAMKLIFLVTFSCE